MDWGLEVVGGGTRVRDIRSCCTFLPCRRPYCHDPSLRDPYCRGPYGCGPWCTTRVYLAVPVYVLKAMGCDDLALQRLSSRTQSRKSFRRVTSRSDVVESSAKVLV
jgi:hypothetical protein